MPDQPPVQTAVPQFSIQPGYKRFQCRQCLAMTDLPASTDHHAVTWCGCCTQAHHHGEAAASCPGNGGVGHPGEPCPYNPRTCADVAPAGSLPDGWTCPGGHCGAGVKGCTVCRPVIHYAYAGEVRAA